MVSVRICGALEIDYGAVDVGLSVEDVIANYTCEPGYTLIGASSRVCQSNGQWSGMAPTCQGVLSL